MHRPNKIGLLVLIFLGFSAAVFALDNPAEKATSAIKKFIISKNPSWFADEINIEYKFSQKTFDSLNSLSENPENNVFFRVSESFAGSRPAGNVFIPLEVVRDPSSPEVIKKFFLKAKIEVLKNIAIAGKYIKKSKIISVDDLNLELRDVSLIPQKYFVNLNLLLNKEAKISIPEGSTIFDWMVGDLPLIHRGSEVTIKVVSPGIEVKTRGEALEDGYWGREIKVKRKGASSSAGTKSGAVKFMTGKVVSSLEVEIQ